MSKGVSIIIPSWNRLDMLKESLTVLKERSMNYPEKEVIVVDDGSDSACLFKYDQMKAENLIDKLVLLPYHNSPRLNDQAYMGGLNVSNPDFPYVHFGADDLLYRTNWLQVLVDMLDSEWAEKYKVRIISGFNHWADPDDFAKMTQYVPEMYKSADGKVQGYAAEWGGNWFFRKDFFTSIGGFANNLQKEKIPSQHGTGYEVVMQYKGFEFGFKWGATLETYVQVIARPNSSTLGNYRRDGRGELVNSIRYRNGIAIGVLWKDE